MNIGTPVRSGYADPRVTYRNMRADLTLLNDQLKSLIENSSANDDVTHGVDRALRAVTDHEQKFPKIFVEADDTVELSSEEEVKYNIARDLVRELNRQCIFLLHASGVVVDTEMMHKYNVIPEEGVKLRRILSEREQREEEFKWHIHTSIEKIEKYIRSHVGEGDKNNEKIQWEISNEMQEWYRDVRMAVRFGLLEHGSSMWIRGHHIVKSWEDHEAKPLKNALLNNIVSSFEFELTKKRTEDQLASPGEGKMFWRDHRWLAGGTAMGSVSGFVIGAVFLGARGVIPSKPDASVQTPKKKQKILPKKVQKKITSLPSISPLSADDHDVSSVPIDDGSTVTQEVETEIDEVVEQTAQQVAEALSNMTSKEQDVRTSHAVESQVVEKAPHTEEVAPHESVAVENRHVDKDTEVTIDKDTKQKQEKTLDSTPTDDGNTVDVAQSVVVQRPRVYVVFMNPVRKGEDIMSVINRVVADTTHEERVPSLSQMSPIDIEQWKKSELQDLGFVYHNGQWGYPFTAHAGAEVELYLDEDGRPHLRVVGEDGKTISMHERVAFREPGYDETYTDSSDDEKIHSDIEILVDEINASVAPGATSEVRAFLDKRLADQVGRPVPAIEGAQIVYDGRAVELLLEGKKRLVVYPERIDDTATHVRWRLRPVVWKLVESDIPVSKARIVSPEEAREDTSI